MKKVNIIGIIVSFCLIPFSYMVMRLIYQMRQTILIYDQKIYGENTIYGGLTANIQKYTILMGVLSVLAIVFLGYMFVLNWVKQKDKGTTAMGVLGLVFSLIMLIWSLMMLSSPSHISFDEVGAVWITYFVLCLGAALLLYRSSKNYLQKTSPTDRAELLDSIEFE